MDHTQTPWIIKTEISNTAAGAPIVSEIRSGNKVVVRLGVLYTKEQQADTEFIVRAVNSHEELVKACKYVKKWLCPNGPLKDDGINHPAFVKACNAVSAAIAGVEGGREDNRD